MCRGGGGAGRGGRRAWAGAERQDPPSLGFPVLQGAPFRAVSVGVGTGSRAPRELGSGGMDLAPPNVGGLQFHPQRRCGPPLEFGAVPTRPPIPLLTSDPFPEQRDRGGKEEMRVRLGTSRSHAASEHGLGERGRGFPCTPSPLRLQPPVRPVPTPKSCSCPRAAGTSLRLPAVPGHGRPTASAPASSWAET